MLNYSMPGGDSGLRLAWRPDSTSQWQSLGYDFVKNDFGPWGSHKKMYAPRLFVNAADSLWTAVWEATPEGDVFALSTTDDFSVWSPQRYFVSELDLHCVPIRPPWTVCASEDMYSMCREDLSIGLLLLLRPVPDVRLFMPNVLPMIRCALQVWTL